MKYKKIHKMLSSRKNILSVIRGNYICSLKKNVPKQMDRGIRKNFTYNGNDDREDAKYNIDKDSLIIPSKSSIIMKVLSKTAISRII